MHSPEKEELINCFEAVRHLEAVYPNFRSWFWDKVVPGLHNGTRLIQTTRKDNEIIGLVIAKLETNEPKKVCTLWVRENERHKGHGIRLLNAAMHWLNDRKPEFSVSELNMSQFSKIIEYYDFNLTSVSRDTLTGQAEYHFNQKGLQNGRPSS